MISRAKYAYRYVFKGVRKGLERCCQKDENRGELEYLGGEVFFRRCVCGRRHFEVTLDPAELGLTFTNQ